MGAFLTFFKAIAIHYAAKYYILSFLDLVFNQHLNENYNTCILYIMSMQWQ